MYVLHLKEGRIEEVIQVAILIVQDILGLSSISTTMRYVHVVPDSKREAIEVLNSYY